MNDKTTEAMTLALEALEDFRFAAGFDRPLAQDAIDALREALANEQTASAQEARKDGYYSVKYRCKCGHEQNVDEIVAAGRTYVGGSANWCGNCGDGPLVRVNQLQEKVNSPRKPLTDEEILQIGETYTDEPWIYDGWSPQFARAIEAAHGITEPSHA